MADTKSEDAGMDDLIARKGHALGLAARLVGAGVFESGRDPYEVLDNDVLPFRVFGNLLNGAEIEVNRPGSELTISLEVADGVRPARTVRYTPGYGCAVLPSGGAGSVLTDLPSPYLPCQSSTPWETVSRGKVDRNIENALHLAFSACVGQECNATSKLDTRAVVIVRSGRIVGERYAPGFGPDSRLLSWSMAKGVTAALLGVYARQFGLELDAPAPIAEWSRSEGDPRADIRSIDILQMASGLDFGRPMSPAHAFSEEDLHNRAYYTAIDSEKFVLSRPLKHKPGSVFEYKNCDPLLLMSLIKQGLLGRGIDAHAWPREHLFAPLGIHGLTIHTDTAGNFIPCGAMYATARDYARIGQFFLQRGVWNGRSLWPEHWYGRITEPSAANPGYAGLVWTNATDMLPGVPSDAFVLSGYFGQRIVVIPSWDMVLVRLGVTLSATTDGGHGTDPGSAPSLFSQHLAQVIQAAAPTW